MAAGPADGRKEFSKAQLAALVLLAYIHGMTIHRAKLFQSGNSQAVRLPKEISYAPETDLVMVRSGDVLTIYPASLSVPDMLALLATMPAPPRVEVRDEDELPEPAGL